MRPAARNAPLAGFTGTRHDNLAPVAVAVTLAGAVRRVSHRQSRKIVVLNVGARVALLASGAGFESHTSALNGLPISFDLDDGLDGAGASVFCSHAVAGDDHSCRPLVKSSGTPGAGSSSAAGFRPWHASHWHQDFSAALKTTSTNSRWLSGLSALGFIRGAPYSRTIGVDHRDGHYNCSEQRRPWDSPHGQSSTCIPVRSFHVLGYLFPGLDLYATVFLQRPCVPPAKFLPTSPSAVYEHHPAHCDMGARSTIAAHCCLLAIRHHGYLLVLGCRCHPLWTLRVSS